MSYLNDEKSFQKNDACLTQRKFRIKMKLTNYFMQRFTKKNMDH